ncbi:MAG: hypothetical protein ACLFTK_17490, partial [Anaerolineales bacterium]
DMLTHVNGYRDCCLYTEPYQVLTVADWVAPVLRLATVAWAGWLLLQMRSLDDNQRFPWSLSVMALTMLLVLTQSKDYTLVYALPAAWLLIWTERGRGWVTGAVFAILASPWLYWSQGWTLIEDRPWEQMLTPLLLAALLTRQWWHVQSRQAAQRTISAQEAASSPAMPAFDSPPRVADNT